MSAVFLVTGAASGIGLALTRQLLARGERVCACDVNVAAMRAQFGDDSDQLRVVALDVRDPEAWDRVTDAVMAAWGRLDVLCNIAGVLRDNWVRDETPADVHFHFDINVKGAIFGMQSALRHMLPYGRGHIINIASMAALSPVPGLALYSASKFAIRSYSLAAGMELAEKGVAVTAICPDAVQTPMLDIQKGKEQAALTFSGSRALTAEEVVAGVFEALDTRALEIVLPGWRGVTAKFANAFPGIAARGVALFRRSGLKRQRAISAGKDSTLS